MLYTRMKTKLKSIARCDFLRDEDGVVAIEAVVIMPMMFWTLLSLFSIFNSFQTYSLNQKAAFAIGDAISRETQPLDDAYLDGMWQLFNYMAKTRGPGAMRVTALHFDGTNDRFDVDWSQTRGWAGALDFQSVGSSASSVAYWKERLPVIPNGERIMLVETWDRHDPAFDTGFEDRIIHNSVYTRPRYAPRVCWEVCD